MISRPAYYARVHIVCEILWYTYCTGNCSKTIFCRIIENRQKNAANGGYKSLSGITFRHSCQSTCKQRQKVTTCKSHSIRSRLLSSCLSTASPLRSLSIKSRTPLIVRDWTTLFVTMCMRNSSSPRSLNNNSRKWFIHCIQHNKRWMVSATFSSLPSSWVTFSTLF